MSDRAWIYSSQDEVPRVDKLAEEIGVIQELRHTYQPILNVILMALDAQAIFMRTKALRALGQIVTSDLPSYPPYVCSDLVVPFKLTPR